MGDFLPFVLGAGGGLLGGMLGGGGGGGSTVTGQQYIPPSVEQVPSLTGGQQDVLGRLTHYLSSQVGRPGRIPPMSLMPGGPGPIQQQAFGMAGGMGQMTQQALNRAGQLFQPGAITEAMKPVGQYATNLFQNQLIPAIMGAAGREGTARSSGVMNQLGRVGKELSLGISSQFAPLALQAQQANLGRQLAIPGVMGQAGTSLANIGAAQRDIGEQQRGFRFGRWQAYDPSQNPALGLANLALGTPGYTNVGFPGQAFQGFRQPSLMESILPAVGTMAGGYLSTPQGAGGFNSLLGRLF
jgi:hypothetical protein